MIELKHLEALASTETRSTMSDETKKRLVITLEYEGSFYDDEPIITTNIVADLVDEVTMEYKLSSVAPAEWKEIAVPYLQKLANVLLEKAEELKSPEARVAEPVLKINKD